MIRIFFVENIVVLESAGLWRLILRLIVLNQRNACRSLNGLLIKTQFLQIGLKPFLEKSLFFLGYGSELILDESNTLHV